jgi:NitT/TauT family transport system substrate-binding protein
MRQAFRAICALAVAALGSLPAVAADKVKAAHSGLVTDSVFFIAEARGYYKSENLDVEHILFDSTAREIAPLGTGELDVGSGLTSAALFNAVGQGIGVRIVAGRSIAQPGDKANVLVVRKDLVDSGRYKSLADLKGMKVALTARSVSTASVLNEAAIKGGLKLDDLETIYLGFPQQTGAFANKAIDASMAVEPFASKWAAAGFAVPVASWGDIYPGYQASVILYSEKLIQQRRDVGVRFLRAIIKASRDYGAAIENGKFKTDAHANEIVKIISAATNLSEADIRAVSPSPVNVEIPLNVAGVRKDLAFMRAQGDVTQPDATVERLVDLSLYEAAIKTLDPRK